MNEVHRTFSRRRFMQSVAGGSLIAGFDGLTCRWVMAGEKTRAPFDGVPPLDGTLLLDDTARREYGQDTGQIVYERPLAILRPGSVRDIVRILEFACEHDLQVAVRGAGHQPFGQAQVRNGIVIDMRSLATVHAITSDSIDVDAGADWRTVLGAALGRGLTPPVLTNYLGLTVGGTLAIGGVGLATFRHGAQVDQALALQVVTGEGKVVDCSPTEHRDVFESALAGQGQCSIITRARLRLVPAATSVREYAVRYADLETLVHDATQLAEDGRFDGCVAVLLPTPSGWSYLLTATKEFNSPDEPDDEVLRAGLRYVPGSEQTRTAAYFDYYDTTLPLDPQKAHPAIGLLIPGSAVASFMQETLPRLTPEDLGPSMGIRLFLWQRRRFTQPLLRLPEEEIIAYAAILGAETTDEQLIERMLAGNRTLFESNRALGGTLYPFAAVKLSQHDWRRHYGSAWSRLVDAKRRQDPHRVLGSGPNLRF